MSPLPQYANSDQWDGYTDARDRFLATIETGAIKDVVVLSGDIHASFANDLGRHLTEAGGYDPATGRGSLAVEIATPSVTSETPSKPKSATDVLAENVWMRHVDLDRHGYVLLDLHPDRAQASFLYVKDVESRTGQEAVFARGVMTLTGESHLRDAGLPTDPPNPPPLAT